MVDASYHNLVPACPEALLSRQPPLVPKASSARLVFSVCLLLFCFSAHNRDLLHFQELRAAEINNQGKITHISSTMETKCFSYPVWLTTEMCVCVECPSPGMCETYLSVQQGCWVVQGFPAFARWERHSRRSQKAQAVLVLCHAAGHSDLLPQNDCRFVPVGSQQRAVCSVMCLGSEICCQTVCCLS